MDENEVPNVAQKVRPKGVHRPRIKSVSTSQPKFTIQHLVEDVGKRPERPPHRPSFLLFRERVEQLGHAGEEARRMWCSGDPDSMEEAAKAVFEELLEDIRQQQAAYAKACAAWGGRLCPRLVCAMEANAGSESMLRQLIKLSRSVMTHLETSVGEAERKEALAGLPEALRSTQLRLSGLKGQRGERQAAALSARLAAAIKLRNAPELEAAADASRAWLVDFRGAPMGQRAERLRRQLRAAELTLHRLRCGAMQTAASQQQQDLSRACDLADTAAIRSGVAQAEELLSAWREHKAELAALGAGGREQPRRTADAAVAMLVAEVEAAKARADHLESLDEDKRLARRLIGGDDGVPDFSGVLALCKELRELRLENQRLRRFEEWRGVARKSEAAIAVADSQLRAKDIVSEARRALAAQFTMEHYRQGSGLLEFSTGCTKVVWELIFPEAAGLSTVDIDGEERFGLEPKTILLGGAILRLSGPLTATFRRSKLAVTGSIAMDVVGFQM